MKKFLTILLVSLIMCNVCFAQDKKGKTPINFIYIHGSDQGAAEEFEVWIDRMHPNMKKNLEASEFIQKHLLSDAYIKPDEEMLYWADKTQKAKNEVEIGLKLSKMVSSLVAQFTRMALARLLHDAIWLQRYANMHVVMNELNQKVIAHYKKGEKSVLLGYSAGTFVTYQYLMYKSRDFELIEFFQKFQKEFEITAEDLKVLKRVNPKPTCIDAVTDANIAVMTADGKLMPISNKQKLRANFEKLDAQTELSCVPDGAVAGTINFGSPVLVFYSDGDEESCPYYFLVKLYRYMIEHGKFELTVNYKTDPLGVPIPNYKFSQFAQSDLFKELKPNGGFLYDKTVSAGPLFFSSHLKYWDQSNHFTKAVAKAYEEGYNYFYGIESKK